MPELRFAITQPRFPRVNVWNSKVSKLTVFIYIVQMHCDMAKNAETL